MTRLGGLPPVPPEPPVGTWVRDRHGAVSQRRTYQGMTGWGEPGIMPFGRWEAMWVVRGPLEVCAPWGADLEPEKPAETPEVAPEPEPLYVRINYGHKVEYLACTLGARIQWKNYASVHVRSITVVPRTQAELESGRTLDGNPELWR